MRYYSKLLATITLFGLLSLACGPGFLAQVQEEPTPSATPTKTPKPPQTGTPIPALMTDTPTLAPSPTDTPLLPTDTAIPVEPTGESATPPVTEEPVPTETPPPEPPAATSPPPEPSEPPAEAAASEPEPEVPAEAEPVYKIVHYKVLGEGENNGGVFNAGGQHLIFLTVLDESGNGLDGVVVKDANGSDLEVMTGDKGPGKAEINMEWDPYKLYVVADPNGPTSSEVSNQMNTANPHIPDIVGRLGDINNEYSVCPTPEIRCTPPFYSVHFSYEITFQRQP